MAKRKSRGRFVILDQLRGSMPEDVKYVTVERCPNMMALDVFYLFGPTETWYVARKVDYEPIYSNPGAFWDDNFGKFAVETDDEPPKRWAAANDVAQSLLSHFKLGQEFCEHKGWNFHACVTLPLAEQESMAGEILEFIKPLLMKEADAPFPRRLPLPTVPCSECGAGVTMRRIEDRVANEVSVMIEGNIREDSGNFVVRCYKCPPKIGPIKCDSGPVEVEKPENLKLLPQNEDVWKAAQTSADVKQLAESTANSVARGKPITMDDCLAGAEEIRKQDEIIRESASGGCTCGAWVTKETHADHCALAK